MTSQIDIEKQRAKEIELLVQSVNELRNESKILLAQFQQVKGGATTTTTTTLPRARVAVIGDQLVNESETIITTALKASPASFTTVDVQSAINKGWGGADANGTTVANNITTQLAKGTPNLWIFALGTTTDATSTQQQNADTSQITSEINSALAGIPTDGNVLFVGVGTQYSYPSSYQWHEAVNNALKTAATNRGVHGYYADWWTWNRDHRPDANTVNAWYRDGVNMTTAGYQAKAAWLAGEADKAMTAAGTTTTTTAPTTNAAPVDLNLAGIVFPGA